MTKIHGSGAAVSIQAPIRANIRTAAASFEEARADFEEAWQVFLAKRTEADFQAWRDQRDWTAEKYRRFDRGERMPTDWKPSRHATSR
jgi:hypothetical protein